MTRFIGWICGIGLGLCVTAAALAQSAAGMVGQQPELRIATLDGGVFDLSEQRGKWVILNYWATWCAPCIKEIPELSELADRDDVEVLGLDFEEVEREELDRFLEQHQPRYAIAPVDVYDPPADFPVPRGLPLTYLVDPRGYVSHAFLGPVTGAEIERAMAEAAAAGGDRDGDGAPAGTGDDGD